MEKTTLYDVKERVPEFKEETAIRTKQIYGCGYCGLRTNLRKIWFLSGRFNPNVRLQRDSFGCPAQDFAEHVELQVVLEEQEALKKKLGHYKGITVLKRDPNITREEKQGVVGALDAEVRLVQVRIDELKALIRRHAHDDVMPETLDSEIIEFRHRVSMPVERWERWKVLDPKRAVALGYGSDFKEFLAEHGFIG